MRKVFRKSIAVLAALETVLWDRVARSEVPDPTGARHIHEPFHYALRPGQGIVLVTSR